jgi:hypothetical protein
MPVNETLALRDGLAEDGLALDAVFVNALYPKRFEDGEVDELEAALDGAGTPLVRAALKAALSEHARGVVQREQRDRLSEGLGMGLTELPYVFTEEIGRPELERLADVLEESLA